MILVNQFEFYFRVSGFLAGRYNEVSPSQESDGFVMKWSDNSLLNMLCNNFG